MTCQCLEELHEQAMNELLAACIWQLESRGVIGYRNTLFWKYGVIHGVYDKMWREAQHEGEPIKCKEC